MLQYSVIGLMYTRTCPLSCAHCITESAPKVKERMRLQQASDYLRVIPRFCSQVCFTGGEPLLYHREIVELTHQAKALGLKVSLVTGAGWVRGEAAARSKLAELVDAGLGSLCISWDQYHEEFSPRERAVALARVATELGLDVEVRTIISANRPKDEFQAVFKDIPVRLQAYPGIALGRAASLPATHFNIADELPTAVCSVVLSPVVEPDGSVYACCGPSHYCQRPSPLMLGHTSAEPLEDILARAVKDPVLEIILNLGPHGLFLLLKDHPVGRARFRARSGYSGMCELCLDITNDPELVDAVRERLADADARRLMVASRLWMDKKLMPIMNKQRFESDKVAEEA